MRILQASAWCLPHQTGGTEVYLEGLVAELNRLGIASEVLTPRIAGGRERYEHDGAPVTTYPGAADAARLDEAGRLEAFAALLRTRPAHIYHQHSWTPDCGAAHLRLAREAGLRTVLTVHVPNNTCLRGSMMRFGEVACDGLVEEVRCAACWAQGQGAPKLVANALAHLPPGVAAAAGRLPSRASTALSARAIGRRRVSDVGVMIANADRIVAVCRWLHDALILNGAPLGKLSLSRQGVSGSFLGGQRADARREGPLRLLYLGRWHPVKGVDVLVRAIRAAPDLPVELTIHAPTGDTDEAAYRARVIALAAGDPRIVVGPPLAREQIPMAMRGFDALAAPSTWLETGPLVVLEAQAVGLYVLGSRLGGIAELVDNSDKGMLVAPGDVAAWTEAIAALAARPPRALPQAVRTMDQAAADMAELYRSLN